MIDLKRIDIRSYIKDRLENNKFSKIILTGIEGAGKSTILSEFYAKYHVLKPSVPLSFVWGCSEDATEFTKYYRLYDRHPMIDYPVYNYSDVKFDPDTNEFCTNPSVIEAIKNSGITDLIIVLTRVSEDSHNHKNYNIEGKLDEFIDNQSSIKINYIKQAVYLQKLLPNLNIRIVND
jgi:hypothetical protein